MSARIQNHIIRRLFLRPPQAEPFIRRVRRKRPADAVPDLFSHAGEDAQ